MNLLQSFFNDIEKSLLLLKNNKDEEARTHFNKHVYDVYKKRVNSSRNVLHKFLWVFLGVDEYFNNESARALGATSKEAVFNIYLEFQEELREIKETGKIKSPQFKLGA